MQMILVMAAVTAFLRFLPFFLFPEGRKIPPIVTYLSRVLPGAVMGMLVIYCLKSVSLTAYPYGLPELIAVSVVVALHLWKRKTLFSVVAGTAVYMVLIQLVF